MTPGVPGIDAHRPLAAPAGTSVTTETKLTVSVERGPAQERLSAGVRPCNRRTLMVEPKVGVTRGVSSHRRSPFSRRLSHRPGRGERTARKPSRINCGAFGPGSTHAVQGGERRDRDGRRLREGKVHRLGCELVRSSAGVLGEGALAGPVDIVVPSAKSAAASATTVSSPGAPIDSARCRPASSAAEGHELGGCV